MLLVDKKVLFIAPAFFGYERLILKELENRGAEITIGFENREQYNYLYRVFNTYCKRIKKYIDIFYYKKLIQNSMFDYIFIIRGSNITPEIMGLIKAHQNSGCKTILYQWDSTDYNPNCLAIYKLFDKVLTFDIRDAEKYGWIYRPLFFDGKLIPEMMKKEYDFSFTGSLHTNRLKILHTMIDYCRKRNLKLYYHIFSKKFIYLKKKYFDRDPAYLEARKSDVSFKTLSIEECYANYNNSKIVVDYTANEQTGFTMRTIECLGCKCKLLTNNKRIVEADFYNSDNIYVYDENDFHIPDYFIKSRYKELNKDMYEYYSLKEWINNIFE